MKKAFTMIELIFVIVILGILASVAIPKLNATRDDAEFVKAVTNLSIVMNDIQSFYTSRGYIVSDISQMTNPSLIDQDKNSKYEKVSVNKSVFGDHTTFPFMVGKRQCAQFIILPEINALAFYYKYNNHSKICKKALQFEKVRQLIRGEFICSNNSETNKFVSSDPTVQAECNQAAAIDEIAKIANYNNDQGNSKKGEELLDQSFSDASHADKLVEFTNKLIDASKKPGSSESFEAFDSDGEITKAINGVNLTCLSGDPKLKELLCDVSFRGLKTKLIGDNGTFTKEIAKQIASDKIDDLKAKNPALASKSNDAIYQGLKDGTLSSKDLVKEKIIIHNEMKPWDPNIGETYFSISFSGGGVKW